MWWWVGSKTFIERSVAFSSDALHVIASVVIMLGAALLLRKPLSSLGPWLVVLVMIIVNEAVDLQVEKWPQRGMQYGESMRDFLLTMLLPTVLLLTARFLPHLFRASTESQAEEEPHFKG